MSKGWNRARLATKVGILGAGLLFIALASIGLTLWIGWQLEGGAAAVNEAGRLRMQTWRLAHQGAVGAGDELPALMQAYDASLELLVHGDPARPLFLPRDERTLRAYAQVSEAWRQLRAGSGLHVLTGAQAEALVKHIDVLVDAVEARMAGWSSLLSTVQLALVGIAIAAAMIFLYASHLVVFAPVDRLRRGLQALEQGTLGARVAEDSQDEFGELARGFNRMAQRLEAVYRGMEDEVRAKTADLRQEQQRLAALYEATAFAAGAASPRELASGFADRMRRVAGADAIMLRWMDASQQRMVLLAAQGLPPAMLEAERCLAPGECHCGSPGAQARVIPITAQHDHGSHCTKAGFVAVTAVALTVQGRVMGEADLLFRELPQPARADRELLDSMASHLASAMEGLRNEAMQREAAVAEERGMLARELHDSIAQSLAFMKIQLQLLKDAQQGGKAAVAARLVEELELGLKESTADVRALLMHFRTRTDGDDLLPALQQTLQKFRLQSGVPAELEVAGHGAPLAADVQVQLLHVVQEALSNIRKHAQASQVQVSLRHQPHWQIDVRDDGRGFDPVLDVPDDSHVGLRIMRERAAKVGAAVALESQPGRGTLVRISLPESEALHP
ncbi:type IV pili methyl-accepting chemotaxis transducer N-terminal domain-containing protein [Roseateles saccharophilus]|uniref:Sensor protein n=1 Tax=Roseateles saccharophilus TaxID=304 RepID=A0A4R3V0T4_ROSSA|nr:type IV pili methyl-accepting chemotaxis transducer N-terminal domain-containing protein [Roseateles saccharophilus]MDG0832337.1 HAMP domain-containing protein [Roseateles saccharophilus]TCU97031.1 two-component system nitrate/nitrite sensor histidine kinase NarX [Roseateles saccharophilus]